MILAIILMTVTIVAAIFYAGMYHERRNWNKLIQKGIVPKPTKKPI